MWRDEFDVSFVAQALVKWVAIVRLVAYQPFGRFFEKRCIDRLLNQRYFVGRSALNAYLDRKTVSVRNCHDLGPFPAFCLVKIKTPFFAELNDPSMKASCKSIPPRSRKSSAIIRNASSIVPSRTHCWNRRWHVWYGGYSRGRSFHRAPVFKTHSTPLRTSLDGVAGRPFLHSRGDVSNTGATRCHRFSVSFISTLDHISRSVSIPSEKRSYFNNLAFNDF